MTLRSRLTAAFVLVVLTPLLIGLVLVVKVLPGLDRTGQARSAQRTAALAAGVVRDFCERARDSAGQAGRAAGTPDRAAAALLARSLVDAGLADGVRVQGPTGATVVAAGAVPRVPVDCRGGTALTQGSTLSAVVALTTGTGRPAGTAVASFRLDGKVIVRLRNAFNPDSVAITDQTGAVVAAAGGLLPGDVRRAQGLEPAQGRRVAGWSPPVEGRPYGVVVVAGAASGPSLVWIGVGVVLVAIALAVVIALACARAVTAPLDELSAAADRVAGGDLSTLIDVRSRDEVGRLSSSFNAMTRELQNHVGQLEASRHELQAGLSRLGDMLSSTHDLDRILAVVLESAIASTRATSGLVLLLGSSGRDLALAAQRGLDLPLDLCLPVGVGVSGEVARTGEAVRGWTGDGPGQLAVAPCEPTGTSVIAVPLLAGGTVIGVLDLFGSAALGGFGESDLATIRTFASQATVAVDNVLLHEEAQRLSVTDALTGLWNYRYFTIAVGREIERAARFTRPLALLMIDLDHFKGINDSFGHPRGDAVLVEAAARVRACVRDVDIVARYGGEELVVVLPETDEQGAGMLAERVCQAIRGKPFGADGQPPVWLTVSAGVAVFPQHGTAASLLLARADEAMYTAKRAGRDQWRLSAPGASGPGAPH